MACRDIFPPRINVMTININEKFVYEFLQLDTSTEYPLKR